MIPNLSFAPGVSVAPAYTAPNLTPSMAPGQAQDPKSQYLAAALQAMKAQPQGSATGLGANMLADALDQYGLQQRAQQLGTNTPQSMVDPSNPPLQGLW